MDISTPRFLLRDFGEADRAGFVRYQMDPRYRRLYDLDDAHMSSANELFSLFLRWQEEVPRRNFQLGIVDKRSCHLCGSAGLRKERGPDDVAVLGIELSADNWGHFRLAVEVAEALIEFGFKELGLQTIVGDTASGNRRIEKLARWFGAELTDERPGPPWMERRGWKEVDWTLSRAQWQEHRRGI